MFVQSSIRLSTVSVSTSPKALSPRFDSAPVYREAELSVAEGAMEEFGKRQKLC